MLAPASAPPLVQERQYAPEIPAKNLPPVPYRDLPEAPPLRKVSSQVGLVFMWAVPLGVLMQYFINMEVERYTLATGETAVAGASTRWWCGPSCCSGVAMLVFIYSGLLIALNRRFLPQPIKIRGVRLGALVWCFGFFGVFSII